MVVLTDAFSKWAESAPLPSQSMVNIAEILVKQVICRFGCPRRLLSDREGNFLSKLAKELYRLLEIKKVSTSSYHPQTDAITERFNATLCDMLFHYVNSKHDDWDHYLPYVTFAYNSSVHATTGYSPFLIIYMREAVLPMDVALGIRNQGPLPRFLYVKRMLRKMIEVNGYVRQSLELSAQKSTLRYDLTRRESEVEAGDLVWMSVPHVPSGLTKKFFHKWFGPYRVIERTTVTCQLRERATNLLHPTSVHVEKLKPFQGEWEDPNADMEPYIPWAERELPQEMPDPEDEMEGIEEVVKPTEDTNAIVEAEVIADPNVTEERWGLEKIIRPCLRRGRPSYEVKWEGWPKTTVEKRSLLRLDAPELIDAFERRHSVEFKKNRVLWVREDSGGI